MIRQLLSLLRLRRGYRALWSGEVVSLLGDWMSYVAVSLLALEQGEGAVALALVLIAHILPKAALAPWAGSLVDRWDRRTVLIAGHVVQAGLTVGMVAAAAEGWLLGVELLLLARASLSAFTIPAATAALGRVVERDELLLANTLAAATWSVTFAVGMAVGGVVAAGGAVFALAVDAATFVVAAGLFSRLPSMAPQGDAGPATSRRALLSEAGDALRYAWHRPELLRAVVAKVPIAMATGAGWILLNLQAEAAAWAGGAAVTLGLLHAIRGVGTGVGPLVSTWFAERGTSVRALLTGANVTSLAGVATFALTGAWPALVVASLLWGGGSGSNWVVTSTELQRRGPDAMLGRLSALDTLLMTAAMAAAVLLAAVVVDATSVPAVAGWIGVVAGVAAWAVQEHVTCGDAEAREQSGRAPRAPGSPRPGVRAHALVRGRLHDRRGPRPHGR